MIKESRGNVISLCFKKRDFLSVRERMIMMIMIANIHKHVVLFLCEDIVQSIVHTLLI